MQVSQLMSDYLESAGRIGMKVGRRYEYFSKWILFEEERMLYVYRLARVSVQPNWCSFSNQPIRQRTILKSLIYKTG